MLVLPNMVMHGRKSDYEFFPLNTNLFSVIQPAISKINKGQIFAKPINILLRKLNPLETASLNWDAKLG